MPDKNDTAVLEQSVRDQQKMQEDEDFEGTLKSNIRTPAEKEFLQRSPEENVKLLDEESRASGLYGFSYVKDGASTPEIPGMDKVEFEIPGDPNGGKYTAYQSYQKTFDDAKKDYQKAVMNGGDLSDASKTYQDAMDTYNSKKAEYENYRYDNPSCPDYLSGGMNPVQGYAAYKSEKDAADSLAKQESEQASGDVSVKQFEESGKKKTVVKTAEEFAAEDNPETVDTSDHYYAMEKGAAITSGTVNGMSAYAKSNHLSLPEITAEKGTDDYGRQVLEQVQATDKALSETNPDYKSSLPEGVQYYQDGENPKAIPGMTIIMGKIDGAPGYYAGYESYDKTYSRTQAECDEKQKKADEAYENGGSVKNANASSDEIQQERDASTKMYDLQKKQYEDYVRENPGNDFLAKSDAVKSYNDYQNMSPDTRRFAGFTDGLKGIWDKVKSWLNDFNTNMKRQLLSRSGVDMTTVYTEDQALQQSNEYWAKRSALNPDDSFAKNKVHDTVEAIKDKSDDKSVEHNGETPDARNDYQKIVDEVSVDDKYEYHNDSVKKSMENSSDKTKSDFEKRALSASTGSDALDGLQQGNPDAAITNLAASIPEGKETDGAKSAASRSAAAMEQKGSGYQLEGSEKPSPNKSSHADRMAALSDLEDRLEAGKSAAKESEMEK